jgi:hypothetical protein
MNPRRAAAEPEFISPTPGPYTTEILPRATDFFARFIVIRDVEGDEGRIALVFAEDEGGAANANLLAQAPDMLLRMEFALRRLRNDPRYADVVTKLDIGVRRAHDSQGLVTELRRVHRSSETVLPGEGELDIRGRSDAI